MRPLPEMHSVLTGIQSLQMCSFLPSHSQATCSWDKVVFRLIMSSMSLMEPMPRLTLLRNWRRLEAWKPRRLWIHLLSLELSAIEVRMFCARSRALNGGNVMMEGSRSMNAASGWNQYGRHRLSRATACQMFGFPTVSARGMSKTAARCMKSCTNQPSLPVTDGMQRPGVLRQAGANHQEPNQQRAASVPLPTSTTPSQSPVTLT
mmetsp:Transcript_79598/g.220153  ORF Transcript_79598/g.220153 Transcript_79598/m.220153 type:complete len:205 (-) Transcript_79598:664-1278(-)